MGYKILFIDDESDRINGIMDALVEAKIWDQDRLSETVRQLSGSDDKFEVFNAAGGERVAIASSFADAFRRVQAAGNGNEYEWFFIDRNLENYDDVQKVKNGQTNSLDVGDKKFAPDFIKGTAFLGDYFYIMLLTAGVPCEKICLLTANELDDRALINSPFVPRVPQSIIKHNTDDNELLKEKLEGSDGAQIRFLYDSVFSSPSVNSVFDKQHIIKFIDFLVELRKSNSWDHDPDDGITLRNMIEEVVNNYILKHQEWHEPEKQGDSDQESEKKNDNKRDNYLRKKFFAPCWKRFGQDLWDLDMARMNLINIKNENELEWFERLDEGNEAHIKIVKDYLSKRKREKVSSFDVDKACKNVFRYQRALNVGELSGFYNSENPPPWPPKCIVSYIDNIYTVTCEISAHTGKEGSYRKLSQDGWEALLHGMLQIMKWVADQPPVGGQATP